jgi:pimeloyl-ACP methyl ester carboxylesterase
MPQASADVIDVRGYDLRVWTAGEGAPLVVFADVFGPQGWAPAFDLLARRHRVIMPEHPGFGGQKVPAWLDKVPDLANFYLDLFDRMDLRSASLAGFGVGGWIAADLAVRNASRLKTLVLTGAAGLHVSELPQPDIFLRGEEQGIRAYIHDAKLADAYITSSLGPECEDVRLQNNEVSARLTWEPRMHDPHLMKWLHRIMLPTLIVWGAEDQVMPVGYAQEWHKRIPGSRVEILPACGHAPQLEKPEAFVSLVETFSASARS